MKDIEFRGLRRDNGEWVYGLLFFSHSTGTYKITHSNGWTPSYNNPDEGESTEYTDIDPETVGMYTGLKDKNDTKIFEGDIVKCHKFTQELGENLGVIEGETEFVATVVFDMYGGTQLVLPNDYYMFVWESEEGWHEESLEVIGNKFQNQELLQ